MATPSGTSSLRPDSLRNQRRSRRARCVRGSNRSNKETDGLRARQDMRWSRRCRRSCRAAQGRRTVHLRWPTCAPARQARDGRVRCVNALFRHDSRNRVAPARRPVGSRQEGRHGSAPRGAQEEEPREADLASPNALETEFGALDRSCTGTTHGVDLAGSRVAHDERTRSDHTIASNAYAVADGRVYADETVLLDDDMAGDDDMGGKKAVVADHGVVADVIPAPQDDIVPDPCAGLDDVRFEDEAVVADGNVVVHDEGLRADVADELVAVRFALFVNGPPDTIHILETDGDKQPDFIRRITPRHVGEADER